MTKISSGAQQVEDAMEHLIDIYRQRGVTMHERLAIKVAFETFFLYQLQQREGDFYEDAKEFIEENAIVKSLAVIRAYLELMDKLPNEEQEAVWTNSYSPHMK